ncbi:hypothetical protein PHMEG_0009578 [Phytophthora megakarya]|uniref:M96 mating-specific protein n=1 Tax=Phytophthora megakarya TaxID=4795 RepID=A0A225WH87_9STRA|nr:hypothetical protein PHMEG_0009578 [Phytophthora megakarya]
MEELKQQLPELSDILQRERSKKKLKRDLDTEKFSLWQLSARHHLQGRLASEAQRRWLQAAIAGKTELIGDLKKVVRQHMKIAALIAAESEGQKAALFLEPTDELLYAMDIQDINDHYKKTDAVFDTCGLDLTIDEKYLQRTMTTDSNEVSVKFGRKQTVMFSFEQTCQSIWLLSNHVHRQLDREEFDQFDDPDTTHASKFRIKCRLPDGGHASLKQRVITRRFMESDRMVLVWKSVIAGEGSLSGIQTDESGWAIIQPSLTGSGTTMQVCMKHVPLHLNIPISEASTVQFDNLLESVIHETDQEITNGAEALLLEDAVKGINVLTRHCRRP